MDELRELARNKVRPIENAERRLRKLVLSHWYEREYRGIKPKPRLALLLVRAAGQYSAKHMTRDTFMKCAAYAYDKFAANGGNVERSTG